jgi:hypothetical protein
LQEQPRINNSYGSDHCLGNPVCLSSYSFGLSHFGSLKESGLLPLPITSSSFMLPNLYSLPLRHHNTRQSQCQLQPEWYRSSENTPRIMCYFVYDKCVHTVMRAPRGVSLRTPRVEVSTHQKAVTGRSRSRESYFSITGIAIPLSSLTTITYQKTHLSESFTTSPATIRPGSSQGS